MKFSNRKRRQAPTIIIISLIDILIVLLIFLMVTTTFKQQPAVKIVLPESREAKEGTSEDPHNLVVTVAKQEPYFYLGKHAITSERLQQELSATAARDPQVSVSIRPDTDSNTGRFFKALDVIHAAGIKNIRILQKKASAPQ
jgi:biopolymer transport protein ExbD